MSSEQPQPNNPPTLQQEKPAKSGTPNASPATSSNSKPTTAATPTTKTTMLDSSSKSKATTTGASSKPKTPTSTSAKSKTATSGQSSSAAPKTQSKRDRLYAKCAADPYRSFYQDELLEMGIASDAKELMTICNQLVATDKLKMYRDEDNAPFFKSRIGEAAQQLSKLSTSEKLVYKQVESTESRGAWRRSLKTRTNLADLALTKALKLLEQKKLIKRANPIRDPSKIVFLLQGETLNEDLTGGCWYTEGELDYDFVENISDYIVSYVREVTWGLGEKVPQETFNAVAARSATAAAAARAEMPALRPEEHKKTKAETKIKPKNSARSKLATSSDTTKAEDIKPEPEPTDDAKPKEQQDTSNIEPPLQPSPVVDPKTHRDLVPHPTNYYKTYPTATDVFKYIDSTNCIQGKSYTREDIELLMEMLALDGRLEKLDSRGGSEKLREKDKRRQKKVEQRKLRRLGLRPMSFIHEPKILKMDSTAVREEQAAANAKKKKKKKPAAALTTSTTATANTNVDNPPQTPAPASSSKTPKSSATPAAATSSAPNNKAGTKRSATTAGVNDDTSTPNPAPPAKKSRKSDPGPSKTATNSTNKKPADKAQQKQPAKRISATVNLVDDVDDDDYEEEIEPEPIYRAARIGLALHPPSRAHQVTGEQEKGEAKPGEAKPGEASAGNGGGPMEVQIGGFMHGESHSENPCCRCPVKLICHPGRDVGPQKCGYMAQWVGLDL